MSRQCCPSSVGCTEHTECVSPRCLLFKKWTRFGFLPVTNTSSEIPSSLVQWSVDSSLFQYHFQMHFVCLTNLPTPRNKHRLGHMVCIAYLHRAISDVVGFLFGHRMVDHTSPCGHGDKISGAIMFPDAVNMSNMKSTCNDTLTQLMRRTSSELYPARRITCIKYSSPSLGKPPDPDADGVVIVSPNIDTFSHSIFIHVCVTRWLYRLYSTCSGWNDRPSSTSSSEYDICMNLPVAVLHLKCRSNLFVMAIVASTPM